MFQTKKIQYFVVFGLMLLAALLRFRFNTSVNYLLIGSVGPYYPLQVRSLLENGRLAFSDMPLIFVIEAFFAKILMFFHITSYENCILWAVKLTDVLLPPLAAIPLFGIAKTLSKDAKIPWFSLLIVAFGILNFTTIFAFMGSGLQKNALAVVWVYAYLHYAIRFLADFSKKYFYKALVFLALCALTHFGCFAIMLFFSSILAFFHFYFQENAFSFLNKKRIFTAAIGIIGFLSILLYFDNQRFMRLANIPSKIFQCPLYLCILDGNFGLNPMSIGNMIIYNGMLFFALVVLFFNRKKMTTFNKIWASSLLVFGLFLSSPLLGLEWSNRLNMLSYIPISVLYLIVFQLINKNWLKILPVLTLLGLVTAALFLGIKGQRGICMSDAAYLDLESIKNKISLSKNATITGRQHVRLLGSWAFGIQNCADYFLKKEDFEKYDAIYVLKQLKGDNLTDNRFKQKPIPPNSTLIYKSEYFELYQVTGSENWDEGFGKPILAKGKITAINANQLIIINETTGVSKTINFTQNTDLQLFTKNKILKEGTFIKVWGKYKVFSLEIEAEKIIEVSNEQI